jgi:hypothetical protein
MMQSIKVILIAIVLLVTVGSAMANDRFFYYDEHSWEDPRYVTTGLTDIQWQDDELVIKATIEQFSCEAIEFLKGRYRIEADKNNVVSVNVESVKKRFVQPWSTICFYDVEFRIPNITRRDFTVVEWIAEYDRWVVRDQLAVTGDNTIRDLCLEDINQCFCHSRGQNKDYCFLQLAQNRNHPEFCEMAGYDKEQCYQSMAFLMRDESLCRHVHPDRQERCVREIDQ